MKETLNTSTENITPEEITLQLENLGILNFNSLAGNLLDIGAEDGSLEKFLSQNKNLNITALDINPPNNKVFEVIKGDARKLPFKDESFDIIIAHASVPNVYISLYSFEHPELSENEIQKAIRTSFNEITRVLKKGGEARLSPVLLAENYDSQKVFKKIVLSELEILSNDGYRVSNEFIKTEINPENQEKTGKYRIIIFKK